MYHKVQFSLHDVDISVLNVLKYDQNVTVLMISAVSSLRLEGSSLTWGMLYWAVRSTAAFMFSILSYPNRQSWKPWAQYDGIWARPIIIGQWKFKLQYGSWVILKHKICFRTYFGILLDSTFRRWSKEKVEIENSADINKFTWSWVLHSFRILEHLELEFKKDGREVEKCGEIQNGVPWAVLFTMETEWAFPSLATNKYK